MNALVFRDPDFFTARKFGGAVAARVLLSTGAAATNGLAVDKRAVQAGRQFQGVTLTVPVEQTGMDSGQSQAVTCTLQHSDASSTGFATLGTAETTTIKNETTSTGQTVRGVAKVTANLIAAKRWVRGVVSYLGSASDTGAGTTATAMTLEFFGPTEGPPS